MTPSNDIKALLEAGIHYGFDRARRHPTASPYLFGTKDRTDIFNLEETGKRLAEACAFVASVAPTGKQILIVGGKHEAASIAASTAQRMNMPYVASRWIGGTLTNFKNITKRLERLQKLSTERDNGELGKYTKRERLMIDRDIEKLLSRFGGLVTMNELPAALFVIDTRYEHTAVQEANQLGIPVIGLSSSDGDFSLIQYPIPGNDTSIKSIQYVAHEISEAFLAARRAK